MVIADEFNRRVPHPSIDLVQIPVSSVQIPIDLVQIPISRVQITIESVQIGTADALCAERRRRSYWLRSFDV
jgi:hypothetical protein